MGAWAYAEVLRLRGGGRVWGLSAKQAGEAGDGRGGRGGVRHGPGGAVGCACGWREGGGGVIARLRGEGVRGLDGFRGDFAGL